MAGQNRGTSEAPTPAFDALDALDESGEETQADALERMAGVVRDAERGAAVVVETAHGTRTMEVYAANEPEDSHFAMTLKTRTTPTQRLRLIFGPIPDDGNGGHDHGPWLEHPEKWEHTRVEDLRLD